jgi:ATP-dependent Lon protease
MSELGLFPLPIVLLPSEQVPLHIFEDRYVELIGECVDRRAEFGLVYADEAGMRKVGTRAAVSEVLGRFSDGRMNVVVEGGERFRLVQLTSGRSFQTGRVAPLVDENDEAEPRAVQQALELFSHLRELTGSEVEIPSTTTQLSFALAAKVELATGVKQELLQELSERTRMNRVCELLASAAAVVERRHRATERAASNGRVDLE